MQSLRPLTFNSRAANFFSQHLLQARTGRRMSACSAAIVKRQALQMQPLSEIEQQLQDSIRAVEAYTQENPHVFNTSKLSRRIRSDLRYIQQLLLEPEQEVTWARWQGSLNNLKGFKGEMAALQEAPGVIAVCKKFRAAATALGSPQQEQLSTAQPQLHSDSSSSSSSSSSSNGDSDNSGSEAGSPRAAGTAGGSGSRGSSQAAELLVEIDVVADYGLTWIEVKNQELFGVHSGHYLGGSGKGKGLAEQVAQMLAVAAAPQHKRRGRSPQVVVYFPSGVDDEVAAALTALGAKVANGTGSLAAVCGIVGNNVTNLDVTTLCALVSEVSWRDPYCDELQAWGARTTHWKVCLEHQQQQPILQELKSVLGHDRQLVVSCAAVSQFEILLQQFSGPSEQQRWEQLLQQLRVYHCIAGCTSSGASSNNTAGHQQACAVCGERLVQQQAVGVHVPGSADQSNCAEQLQLLPQLEGCCFPLSERLQNLEKMSLLQQAVFSLGDALHAVTVTANGSAVRAAAACGVHVDAVQHRPVWLTGL